MTTRIADTSPRTYARAVGVLYLLLFILGPFAFFLGRTSIVVPGDPAATLGKLSISELAFQFVMLAVTLLPCLRDLHRQQGTSRTA